MFIKVQQLLIFYSEIIDEEETIVQAHYKNCMIFMDNKNIYVKYKNKDNTDYDKSYFDEYEPTDIICFQFLNLE